ncbi:2OG-Fe(II) oxygenase family protein [Streptomyces sp. 351MFTsu5.1]|uniref:2OG-Fe(II) oxygenase family protein n=1 Tax=Streptomyces sp. 351MFTsu5.1 TaxID=1172180 RepID=UPI00036A8465|nr:2OG-Fe(II) oxygenase family protein [Streptomyces sp. 351MFTsu5.1]
MHVATIEYTNPHAPAEFAASMHATGFGVVVNHPLAATGLPEQIQEEWARFFATDAKVKYANSGGQDGFFPSPVNGGPDAPKLDRKEFFQVMRDGRYPEEVSDSALRYFDEARHLAAMLLGWLGDAVPTSVSRRFAMPLPRMLEGSFSTTLRIQRYLPATGEETPDSLRGLSHTDLNLITVLPAPREPGLQVRDSAGEWHDVPCDAGAFVINAGEMLEQITGGYYRATEHRVRFPAGGDGGRSRFSMPMFLHPAGDIRLNEQYTAASFLRKRIDDLRRMGWRPAPGGQADDGDEAVGAGADGGRVPTRP